MTVDIPALVLKEAMKFTDTKTRHEAVIVAVKEFNRRHRLAALAERLHGSCPDFMTQAELKAIRTADTAKVFMKQARRRNTRRN